MRKLNKKKEIAIVFLVFFALFIAFCWNTSDYNDEKTLSEPITEKNSPKTSINLDWNKTIDSACEASVRDVAVDSADDIYITGKEYDNSKGFFTILIAKYDSEGILLWKKNRTGDLDSVGYGIVVDSSQNLYICGFITNSSGDVNLIVLKYTSEGIYLQNNTWGFVGDDIGYDIAVDNNGEIYVTGITQKNDPFGDVVLLKFNEELELQYNRMWGDSDTDIGYSIALDSDNNIYITGVINLISPERTNLLLLKYNNLGNFERNVNWGGEFEDEGRSVILDSEGNIFVSGYTKNEGNGLSDMLLMKFNKTFDLQYFSTFGGTEREISYEIVLDSKNNTYLCGFSESYGGVDKDACLVKFNSTGDFKWYKLWNQDQNYDSIAYSISINSNENLIVAGETNNDVFVSKYSLGPGEFVLSSEIDVPQKGIDSDGNFTVTWDQSLDAINYSLYRSHEPITQFHDALIEVVKGNINRTVEIKDLEENVHYFKAFSFNSYGNISSNCLKIEVKHLPENFTLFEHLDNPDPDGIVLLIWETSNGADNYSIYEIGSEWNLIEQGVIDTFYEVKDLINNDYTFVICAINEAGKTISNTILVVVRRAPDSFNLYSDCPNGIDDDGNFDLLWTQSTFADNYTVYFSTSYITNIDDSLEILIKDYVPDFSSTICKYEIRHKGEGKYYYLLCAKNMYGQENSNCIEIMVSFEKEDNGDNDGNSSNTDNPPSDITPFLTMLGITVLFVGIGGIYYFGKKLTIRK